HQLVGVVQPVEVDEQPARGDQQQREQLAVGRVEHPHPLMASAMASRAARAAGRTPPSSPMAMANRVAFTAMSGAKWKLNFTSVNDPKFVVVNEAAASSAASTHPPAAPIRARMMLSTRKLPSTERRRNPSARKVPTSRIR